jgi:hypothetical protein
VEIKLNRALPPRKIRRTWESGALDGELMKSARQLEPLNREREVFNMQTHFQPQSHKGSKLLLKD